MHPWFSDNFFDVNMFQAEIRIDIRSLRVIFLFVFFRLLVLIFFKDIMGDSLFRL